MHIKIFSLKQCKDCSEYHDIVDSFCKDHKLTYEVIDLDIEEHVKEIIAYRLTFIPSTVFFNAEDENVLVNKGGLLTREQLDQLYDTALLLHLSFRRNL